MTLHHCAFLIGNDFGFNVIDAEAPSDRFRSSPVVAGQHDDVDPFRLQCRESLKCRTFDRIGDRKDAGDTTIDRHEDCGSPIYSQFFSLIRQSGYTNAQLTEEFCISKCDPLAFYDPDGPLSGW